MDQGIVAEIGSYEGLMNHDGAFAKFMKTYLNEQHSDDSDSDDECKYMRPYPCFISFLYLDLYVLGDDTWIS